MCKNLCIYLLACLLMMGLSHAHADDGPTVRDVRCLVLGMSILKFGDAQHRPIGTMLMTYYVGKITGRTPDLDLESAINRQLRRMKPADYEAEARRCGAEVTAKGRQLARIGRDMAAAKQAGHH